VCVGLQGAQSRRLRHFHYLEWPDNGVPAQESLVSFVEIVGDEIPTRGGPVVVHCRSVGNYTVFDDLIAVFATARMS